MRACVVDTWHATFVVILTAATAVASPHILSLQEKEVKLVRSILCTQKRRVEPSYARRSQREPRYLCAMFAATMPTLVPSPRSATTLTRSSAKSLSR